MSWEDHRPVASPVSGRGRGLGIRTVLPSPPRTLSPVASGTMTGQGPLNDLRWVWPGESRSGENVTLVSQGPSVTTSMWLQWAELRSWVDVVAWPISDHRKD